MRAHDYGPALVSQVTAAIVFEGYVMRVLICAVVLLVASDAMAGERYKITNDRRVELGDFYDPGHNRRIQIRDARRNIIGYVERDGTVTDSRRRKVGKIGELIGGG
jgi:hypothetical protein